MARNVQLTKAYVQKWCDSSLIYRRGEAYYNERRVQNLYYDESDSTWYALVRGSETYDVSIQIVNGQVMEEHCNCPAYKSYWVCKHLVAAMLAIVEKTTTSFNHPTVDAKISEDDFVKRWQYQVAGDWIHAFQLNRNDEHMVEQNIDRVPLQVEYICHTVTGGRQLSRLLSVELKVGVQRTYVVKQVNEFLQAIKEGTALFFTKNFTYDPIEHCFTPEDEAMIQLLLEVMEDQQFYSGMGYGVRYGAQNDRYMLIPPAFGDRFMKLLQGKRLTFVTDTKRYSHIEIVEEELPLSLQVKNGANAEEFQIDLSALQHAVWFDSYRWLFMEGSLYRLNEQQASVFRQFMHLYEQRRPAAMRSITVSREQMGEFISYVIPDLKKIAAVEIDQNISDQIASPPLKVNLYLDSGEERITFQLEYVYDDVVINPFQHETMGAADPHNEERILVRDTEKEHRVMRTLERSDVRYNGHECFIEGEEEMYHFLFHTIPALSSVADIYMTERVQTYLLPADQSPNTRIDVIGSGQLLDVHFNMDGIDDEEVQRILASVIEKKKYVRLENGAFVSLEDESFRLWDDIISEFDIGLSDLKEGKFQLPAYRSLRLNDLVEGKQHIGPRLGAAFRRLIRDMKHPDMLEFEVPRTLQADLRDYQRYGFQWLKTLARYRLGGILADDMGLGKTLQSIAFLLSEIKDGRADHEGDVTENVTDNVPEDADAEAVKLHAAENEVEEKDVADAHRMPTIPALVVVPASLVYNWKAEFDKFAPELHVETIYGTPLERHAILAKYGLIKSEEDAASQLQTDEVSTRPPDILITTYPLLQQDVSIYENIPFDTLILDEAQAVKNEFTQTARAVRKINAVKRFALSGTPIENSLDELRSIFDVILPGFFPRSKIYRELSNERIAKMARPFILRRLKQDVLKELPDKFETVLHSELTKRQKELYVGYLARIRAETEQSIATEGFTKSRIKILAGLTRLKQLCCHPSLFLENYDGDSGKLEQFMEVTENALESGKRLLIFSQFTSMLHLIREKLTEAGHDLFYLDGQTPSKERVEMATRFNEGERSIFLVSLRAGGTGLNLTGADTVMLYDLWWNPAVEEQAASRAHRMGQKNSVHVMRFIARGTIEEKIYELQQRKKQLLQEVIQPGETMLSSLTEEELREILF